MCVLPRAGVANVLLLCCIKESVSLVLPGSGVMPEKQMMPIFWLHLASFALAVGSNWHHLLWHLALELGILGHHLRKKQMASFASLAMPLCFSGMTPKQMACQSVCSLSNTQTQYVHRLMISLALALALSRALSTYRERQRERASARARASEIERCLSLERFTCSGLMPDKQNMPITLVSSQKTH